MLLTVPATATPDRTAVRSEAAHPGEDGAAIRLSLYDNLAAVEVLWRAFEATADCTPFQSFAWHKAWQDNVGDQRHALPAIVVGRQGGRVLFLIPLSVEPARFARRLVWHAAELCDYNAPLLAPDFAGVVPAGGFVSLWRSIMTLIAEAPPLRHDVCVLKRMPETVGGQRNPFLDLDVSLNPSGAYHMTVSAPWEQFYRDKRSSATRRHDRSKRKRLSEFGAVSFVTAEEPRAIRSTLETLFVQKAASFATRGVSNFLARPGIREFFRAVALDPSLHGIVHVSRLDVGSAVAAANLGLVFRGRYYHVLASHDGGSLSRFGPGTTHLHELMDYAIRRGCSEFDFTVGDEAYKRDWCDAEQRLYDFRAASNARGFAAANASLTATRVKRLVKQTPALWAAFTRIRRAAGYLKGGRGRPPATPVALSEHGPSGNI